MLDSSRSKLQIFGKIIFEVAVIYTDPSNPPDPQTFEKGDLTTPQPLEKLKFYFRRFFINSLEIVIFQ